MRFRLMRLLVIDSSSDAGDQRLGRNIGTGTVEVPLLSTVDAGGGSHGTLKACFSSVRSDASFEELSCRRRAIHDVMVGSGDG